MYLLALNAGQIRGLLDVVRMRRGQDGELAGYQRVEAGRHVAAIRDYLQSPEALLPNALVVAFGPATRFLGPGPAGHLEIRAEPGKAAGVLVDGQQRAAALRGSGAGFPVPVAGFVARDAAQERDQFLLINQAKPLHRSLINELLPETEAALPPAMARRALPAALAVELNLREGSPLQGMIRTHTCPDGVITDTSLIRFAANSISDGALHRMRGPGGEADRPRMIAALEAFWAAVRDVFPDAWGLPPRKSRLMHGAGVVAMGFLMDEIDPGSGPAPSRSQFAAALELVAPRCAWTGGTWQLPSGPRPAFSIQNTGADAVALADHLTGTLRQARGGSRGAGGRQQRAEAGGGHRADAPDRDQAHAQPHRNRRARRAGQRRQQPGGGRDQAGSEQRHA